MNGQARITTASSATTPAPTGPETTAGKDEDPGWGQLCTHSAGPATLAHMRASTADKSLTAFAQRLRKQLRTHLAQRHLWWIIAAAAAACLLAILLVWWATRHDRGDPPPPLPPPAARPTLFVNPQRQGPDVVGRLEAALSRIRKDYPGLGGRIVLQQDIAEEVLVEQANVTIESDERHQFSWMPPAGAPVRHKLLVLYNAANFHLQRVALDGDNREEAAVCLSGNCAGTTLDDVTIRGFTRRGVWVYSCRGEPKREVTLARLAVATAKPEQVGFFFDISDVLKTKFPTNEHIVVRDCSVTGPGIKVKAVDRKAVEKVTLSDNLKPGLVFGK
jgi:hypothetical protein